MYDIGHPTAISSGDERVGTWAEPPRWKGKSELEERVIRIIAYVSVSMVCIVHTNVHERTVI